MLDFTRFLYQLFLVLGLPFLRPQHLQVIEYGKTCGRGLYWHTKNLYFIFHQKYTHVFCVENTTKAVLVASLDFEGIVGL